ncbi:ATP-binding protein [Pontibacter korlensis]|uniref:Stage II sporulation protein E n=1 Tax=Pontibacter korlensis TaxID=400092 RepID=A0A0E3ZI79_9BACT|nr:ATP-binding protein [Pontibacter korlensis]AKD05233.1 stage II sporulation protein E [Pontibacter korlensis]
MDVNQHQRFLIPDKSYANIAKRDITSIAERMGMSANEVGKLNIVVSEMVSNLSKHAAQGGELLVRSLGLPTEGIEVICLDNGPGMSDPVKMQEDGVSTFGTAGEGLGAIKRQSDVFDLYSQQGVGTVILSRILKHSKAATAPQAEKSHEVGYVLVPKPKETLCGDGLAIIEKGKELYLLALDGLGHGLNAHEAAQLAVQVYTSSPSLLPADALRHIHHSIKRTRGAVGFVANISANNWRMSYCGIGNIAGKLYAPDSSYGNNPYKNMISYNGILGHNIPTTLNNQELEWGRHRTIVLHSDGLKSRWDLSKYQSLNRCLPTTVAALLYKDNSRQTDDTLVVVCRSRP